MATLILQETYLMLEEEMKSINKLRSETALQIQEAASHGDLKENYEYKAAKEKMEFVVYKKQLLQSHAPFKFIDYNEIENDEVGFVLLRLVQILGQDNFQDLGSETLFFIISALNQLDIDKLRNKILLKVLPLKV